MSFDTPSPTQEHTQQIRTHYDQKTKRPGWVGRGYRRLLGHYYRLIIPTDSSVLEIGCGEGSLLTQIKARRKVGVDLSKTQIQLATALEPNAEFHCAAVEDIVLEETFDYIILSDTLNLLADVQKTLDQLVRFANPGTRLVLNFHNNLWRPLFSLAEVLGLRDSQPLTSWLSSNDVLNLLRLSAWEPIKIQARILWPLETPVLSPLLNRWLAPLFPFFCLSLFCIGRLRAPAVPRSLSVSVLIPARNEAGNIENALRRTPQMGTWTELIFVEGNSTDNTWAEIQRLAKEYPELRIKTLQQTGKGKGNAVRDGFAVAEGDLLMILDADLTMPPEELPKFYEAVASGRAEFANGCRLVYPMEKRAMQFLNMLANKFFGMAFSWLLGQNLKDTLCGTKVLTREHYQRVQANRAYFGDFDPFGDFDLLFGADKLNLKICDIPIRYKERVYGETNIQRWKHGALLFRMLGFAARKLKFV